MSIYMWDLNYSRIFFSYEVNYISYMYLSNHSAQARYSARSIFWKILAGLNSKFFFPKTGCHSKVKDSKWQISNHNTFWKKLIIRSLPLWIRQHKYWGKSRKRRNFASIWCIHIYLSDVQSSTILILNLISYILFRESYSYIVKNLAERSLGLPEVSLSRADTQRCIERRCWGVRPSLNECLGYDIKLYDDEAPVMLKLWGTRSTLSLLSLPGSTVA